MNTTLRQLWKEIQNNYYKENYSKTLKLINEYLKIESVAVNTKIISFYIDCNIKLENFNEAVETLDKIQSLPNFFNKFILATKYVECFEFNKAKEFINSRHFTDKEYLKLAKLFLYYHQFDIAKIYFNYCSSSESAKIVSTAKKYLIKINTHINQGIFLEQNYQSFKKDGKVLEPGHVIMANIKGSSYNTSDEKYNTRPYMIWKIIDKTIYCFPLSSKTNSESYILYEQNYLNFDVDGRIKDTIFEIKENDIEHVFEKINNKDFNMIMYDLYFCIYFHDTKTPNEKMFAHDFIENWNVESKNIISFHDKKTKLKSYYFILEIKEDNYKVVELNYDHINKTFSILNNEIKHISKSEMILNFIKLDDDRKQNLYNEHINLNKNIKKLSLEKKID